MDEVVFAYSDVDETSCTSPAGALGRRRVPAAAPRATMISSSRPVIAVCAVRTGCGKSQTTRRVASLLREAAGASS